MTIKTKLILLLLLVCLLVGGVVVHLFQGTMLVRQKVQLFVPATEYLLTIAKAQTSITAQMKEALDYLLTARAEDFAEFRLHGEAAGIAFDHWKEVIEQQQALGVEGEDEDLSHVVEIESLYQQWQAEVAELLAFHWEKLGHEHPGIANAPWAHAAEHKSIPERIVSLEEQIFPGTNDALADGFLEVEEAYHGLLVAFGGIALPFSGSDLNRLEDAHVVIDVVIGGHRLNASTNLQMAALVRYLMSGTNSDLEHYRNRAFLAWNNFDNWQDVALQRFAMRGEDAPQLLKLAFTRNQSLMDQAAELKQVGKDAEAFELVSSTLEIDMTGEGEETIYNNLQHTGEELVAMASSTSRLGALVLLAFLFVILTLFVVEFRKIVGRFGQLQDGMLRIGAGDLDHRINLPRIDELGELSGVFDQMVIDLRSSRDDLELLNQELEQRVIQRTGQLAEKNHELEAFNSMVSHDLRGQLTIVGGLAQLLQSRNEYQLNPDEGVLLQRIVDAGDRMNQIIESLHCLAKMGAEEIEQVPVDLSKMVAQVGKRLQEEYPRYGIQLQTLPGVVVEGDRNLLLILLENLLGNAWKYSSGRERGLIQFGYEMLNDEPVIFLRDNGIGFNQTEEEKLFAPFQRLNSAAEFPGRGIGLSTVRRIVERHGGRIWGRGTPGEGATFYLVLPGLKLQDKQSKIRAINE